MGTISVEKVKPGMVLADKVMTPKKMMLLPEGAELTVAHLITFQTWGDYRGKYCWGIRC